MDPYIPLSWSDVALAGVLILLNGVFSLWLNLGLHFRLVIAALRSVAQLWLMGLVLGTLFSLVSPLWTGLAALVMIGFAGHEVSSRQDKRLAGWWTRGLGTGAILMAAMLATLFALFSALHTDPWYDPRYAIPLLGMILGNTMNGVALGLSGVTSGLSVRRAAVEAQLMLGATRRQAMAPVIRQSLRTALMPIINTMSATGVVALPGMMTGQILGGVAPTEAVKYQIMILFLIAGGTGIGAVAAVLGAAWRLSDHRHRLRLDRLVSSGP